MMLPANTKIKRFELIEDDLREIFLSNMSSDTNYFEWKNPQTVIQKAIVEFIDRQKFNCNKKYIEFWFQQQSDDNYLRPHVDFNEKFRVKLSEGEHIEPHRLMSPITIACYLDIDSMQGGELCISHKSWLDYDREIQPTEKLLAELLKYTYETYKPVTGDVLYFEGSRYYHWIQKLHSGSRKSMLINFWDEV